MVNYPHPLDHTFEKIRPVHVIESGNKMAKDLLKRDRKDKTKDCEGEGCKEVLVNVHGCQKYCVSCSAIRCARQKTASEKKRYSRLLRERARKATTSDQVVDRLKYKEWYKNKVQDGVKVKTSSVQAAIPEPTYYDEKFFKKDRTDWIPWEPEA